MSMQRIFGILTFLIFSASFVSAQTNFQAGLTIGSNYSNLSSDLFSTSSGKAGVAAGLSMVMAFNDHFELNQEVVFTQKGANAEAVRFMSQEQVATYTYSYNYNTFETGLFAGIQPVKNIPVKLQLGGFFGTHFHNMDASQRDLWVGNALTPATATLAVKLNPAFSGLDFGPAAGISVGTQRVRVSARYYLGTRNLYNNLDFVEGGHRINTRSVRVALTYLIK